MPRVTQAERALAVRESLPAELKKVRLLARAMGAELDIRIRQLPDGQPIKLELIATDGQRTTLSYSARELAVRQSVLQSPGASIIGGRFQESQFQRAVAKELAGGQTPSRDHVQFARFALKKLLQALVAGRAGPGYERLKLARRPSIRGRSPTAQLLAEAALVSPTAGERVEQAVKLVPALPIVFPTTMWPGLITDLAAGRSLKELLKEADLSWSLRHIRAGVLGELVNGVDAELLSRVTDLAGSAGALPPQTNPQRWVIRAVLPLARYWAADPALKDRVLWLMRAVAADVAAGNAAPSTTREVDGHQLAAWLSRPDAAVPEPLRWSKKLILADAWARCRQWTAIEPEPQKGRPSESYWPTPWMSRGVHGDVEVIPIESAFALRALGEEQHHCAGSYVNTVRAGKSYIFATRDAKTGRTLSTLELGVSVGLDGVPRPVALQHRAAFNKAPSAAVKQAVDEWLAAGVGFKPPQAAVDRAVAFRAERQEVAANA